MVRKGTFAKYDYGWIGNLRHYFSIRPPEYDLQAIPTTLPILVAYGGMDALSDPLDVHRLCYRLPKLPQELYIPQYAHGDFILGSTARSEVYDRIVQFLDESHSNSQSQ